MFYCRIELPFQTLLKLPKRKDQTDYVMIEKKITANKFIEFQVSRWSQTELFNLSFGLEFFGQDHAGLELAVTIYGFGFILGFRDRRHWNHTEHRWMTDEEYADDFQVFSRNLTTETSVTKEV